MNYRHSFHAGNFADIHKHWILLLVLQRLLQKDKPLFVLDSHAGVGFYDLTHSESRRGGETSAALPRGKESLRCEFRVRSSAHEKGGLNGSGMFLLNPPYTVLDSLEAGMPELVKCLEQDDGADFRIISL